jgi:hypothetical protein
MSELDSAREIIRNAKKQRRLVLIGAIVGTIAISQLQIDALSTIFMIGSFGYYFFLRFQFKRTAAASPAITQVLEELRAEAAEAAHQIQQTKTVSAKYEVGLEKYMLNGTYQISSAKDGLTLTAARGKNSVSIPWSELIEVEAGSEADLRSRVTLSRVLLIGVFAIGAKKEKKKSFYLSIATENSVGLFELSAGGNNRDNEKKARVFAAACNARIKQVNPNAKAVVDPKTASNYDEIEKLGSLLEKGLLTQAEFDKKKKQILGL